MKPEGPKRLREDPLSAQQMRADLERSVAQSPIDYDTDAGLEILRRRLELASSDLADPIQSAFASGGSAASSSVAVKAAVALAGLTAVVGVGLWSSSRGSQQPSNPARQDETSPALQAAPEETVLGPRQEPPAPAVVGTLAQEAAELGHTRALLSAGDAAGALELAEQGHARFVGGALYPEREALAILALCELGERVQAEQRARAFADVYPDHPMRDRLRAAIQALEVKP